MESEVDGVVDDVAAGVAAGACVCATRRGAKAKRKRKTRQRAGSARFIEELDAAIVARDGREGNGAKPLQGEKLFRKGTTTNRRGTKTSTTFCVFLLTGISQALILRFQIRGTWKRQADRVEDVRIGP